MYNSKIVAFDSFTPGAVVTNADLASVVDTSDEWITTRTGISKRHISKKETTSDIAASVAKNLIKKANKTPEDISLIIVATITPDYLTPATSCIVQGEIGATNALAFDISAACSGFIYAFSIADKFLKAGFKNALVIGAETMSKITNWQDRSTCVLFGDGAGGVFLESSEGENALIAEDLQSDGKKWQALTGGKINLKNLFVKDTDKDTEDDFFLKMNGKDVFSFATKIVPKSIEKILKKSNYSLNEIKYIVPHQANYRIVEAVAKKLKAPLEKFYLNLKNFGNTSSASIPIALAEMFEKKLIKKGDKLILTGFGAGLTWGSMLITV